jgi:hypothetical protein
MATRRAFALPQILLMAGALVAPVVLSQTVPPPGVGAARPPTERTLQPVDRSQTRERVRTSRDCKHEGAEIRGQYRIQQDSVRTQYAVRIAAASGPDRAAAVRERDSKLAELSREADFAAKQLGDRCRADNAATLRGSTNPADRP